MFETISMLLISISLFIFEIHKEKRDFEKKRIRDNENLLIEFELFLNSKRGKP